jgi:hypothetical protein
MRLLMMILAAAACFGLAGAACSGKPMHAGDPNIYGVDLAVDPSAAPYTRAADFVSRVKRILAMSAAFYGRDPSDFAGLRIVFRGPLFQCGDYHGARGCNDPDNNTITIAEPNPTCYDNVETSVLPHELLHYFIIDPRHTNPLWTALDPLWWRVHDGVPCTAPENVCGEVCAYPWEWDIPH